MIETLFEPVLKETHKIGAKVDQQVLTEVSQIESQLEQLVEVLSVTEEQRIDKVREEMRQSEEERVQALMAENQAKLAEKVGQLADREERTSNLLAEKDLKIRAGGACEIGTQRSLEKPADCSRRSSLRDRWEGLCPRSCEGLRSRGDQGHKNQH